jgi:hypothetical protein
MDLAAAHVKGIVKIAILATCNGNYKKSLYNINIGTK